MSEESKVPSLSVCVAIDGCRLSERAFELALSMRRGKGKLNVLHVSDKHIRDLVPHVTPTYIEEEYDLLCRRAGLRREQYDIRIVDMRHASDQAKHGRRGAADIIIAEVAELGSNILVLGAHGQKGPSVWKIGSSVDVSVRRSRAHTVVVKPDRADLDEDDAKTRRLSEELASHHVIACIDGCTPMTEAVLNVVRALARKDLRVTVLHVRDEWLETLSSYSTSEVRKRAVDALRDCPGTSEVLVVDRDHSGPLSHQICDFAAGQDASLVLLGVDGMRAFTEGREVLGSIADYVVRHARTNVMVCKRGKRA